MEGALAHPSVLWGLITIGGLDGGALILIKAPQTPVNHSVFPLGGRGKKGVGKGPRTFPILLPA